MIKYTIKINNVDYSNYCLLPFSETYALDESLDFAVLSLQNTNIEQVFKSFSLVEITKDDGENVDIYNYYVAKDTVIEIVGTGKYNHEISLIEETKIAEKIIVDTCTITQPLPKSYSTESAYTFPIGTAPYSAIANNTYKTPLAKGSNLRTKAASNLVNIKFGFLQNELVYARQYVLHNGTIIRDHSGGGEAYNHTFRLDNMGVGNYSIYYEIDILKYIALATVYVKYRFHYNFEVVDDDIINKNDKTITSEINRLLQICETLRKDETPRFTFNSEQAEEFAEIKCSEFAFTKKTLRECLDQIAGNLQCISRITQGVIYFDKLGGIEEIKLPDDYVFNQKSQDIVDFCSKLDSDVDNLVNSNKDNTGAVIEPYDSGWFSTRAESGEVRIGDDTSVFQTKERIHKIIKLEIGELSNGLYVGDITSYVYEKDVYLGLLSSYDNTYPYSKAYGIYYNRGEKNIKGLDFKLPNAIHTVFSKMAIINIIESKTGQNVSTLFNNYELTKIPYRITYETIVDARVKQSKTYLGDYNDNYAIVYNQQANKVQANEYGKNLKGMVERLGNVEELRTYLFKEIKEIPEVGKIVDKDKYITVINMENSNEYIKATIGLSKDFNRISPNIEIKRDLRESEVSLEQAYDRHIVYEDYCVLGESVDYTDNNSLFKTSGVSLFLMSMFGIDMPNPISLVQAKTYDKDLNSIRFVDLPITAMPIGNSLTFTFNFEDNYSAGNQSQSSGRNEYRLQNYVSYGDFFGEFEYLKVDFYRQGVLPDDYANIMAVANALPSSTFQITEPVKMTTGDNHIVVKKDSRERIKFTYQLHFITNDKDIIIGDGLAGTNGMVNRYKEMQYSKLYVLPYKLNKLYNKLDLTNAVLIKDFDAYAEGVETWNDNEIIFKEQTASANGKSWALIDVSSGELLFGKNIDLNNQDIITMPNMTFIHNPYKK